MSENESVRPVGEAPDVEQRPADPADPADQTAELPAPQPSAAPHPPIWAQPPAGAAPAPQPRRRVGKGLALGAAAVALALSSGAVGAGVALGLSENGETSATRTYQAAPAVDRSSLADIAASVQPSAVSVRTGTGEGSGVVLSEDGYLLTNNHVVESAPRGSRLTVAFSNGKIARAAIVGTDPRTDLAVLKAAASGLTPAKFGDSDAMRVGDTVLALGSPLGLDGSVTAGIVSAVDRTIQVGRERAGSGVTSIAGVIQTDAAINPGNSGGALVNLNGEVIGINTAIATSGPGSGNIGVGFAIPGNRAKLVADQLREGEQVKHPFLGVAVTPAQGGGAEVTTVQPGSPAAAAGIQEGDVITKVGDTLIQDSDDLVSAVQSRKVGDRVEITYRRGNSEQTATATLAEAS